jgi:7-cyano-7-deazaguanine synthase
MKKFDGVLLASGGLDSTTLAFWLEKQGLSFIPLFIDYGQHCAQKELETLKKVLPLTAVSSLECIDIKGVYRYSQSRFVRPANLWEEKITADDLYLPYRNILLLSLGSSFAQTLGINVVYSAFINSNHAKEIDCSTKFFNQIEQILSDYGSVKIEMPFRYFSKYQVAKIGIELKAPIGSTFSCQASPEIPCGACPNCVDRLNALKILEDEFYHRSN